MNTAIESIGYPKQLVLHNKFSDTRYHMWLKDVAQIPRKVVLEDSSGEHLVLRKEFECQVTEAAAIFGLCVQILAPKGRAYQAECKDAKVSMTLDKEPLIQNEPLSGCAEIQGKNFQPSKLMFDALSGKDFLGVFIPNGTVIEVSIAGLPKTKAPVKVGVTVDMAVYTTKP